MSNETMILGRLPVFDDKLFHTANARNCNRGWVKFINHEGPGEVRVRCENGAVPIVKIENLQWEAMTEQQELAELYAELADGNKLARRALCHIKEQQSQMEELRALLAQHANTVLGFKVVEDPSMPPDTMRMVQPDAQHQGATFEQWFEVGKLALESELTTEALMEGAYIAGQQSVQLQGEPVAWRVQRVTPTGNHRLDRPLLTLATPEEWGPAWNAEPLYTRPAEQPAPAAVVLPERKAIQAETPQAAWSFKRGWNACLDEIAHLNPGVKP